jgi:hypothetical protein
MSKRSIITAKNRINEIFLVPYFKGCAQLPRRKSADHGAQDFPQKESHQEKEKP